MIIKYGMRLFILAIILLVNVDCAGDYHTFADYPGMEEYYRDRCQDSPPSISRKELKLLEEHRPRFVLPPGGTRPIDFYRDYIPNTVLMSWPDKMLAGTPVTRGLLQKHRTSRDRYLDLDREKFLGSLDGQGTETKVYGRVYREKVSFPAADGSTQSHNLTFLKYNLVFPTSGLPAELSFWSGILIDIGGFDPADWHELDNFVAAHIVLDESESPVAVILAQHNHHRTYVAGKDIFPDEDGRFTFDVAERSNEIYPDSRSEQPVRHRVIRWSLYLDYLLSGENPPFLTAFDVTYSKEAGGETIDPVLEALSPCDPMYTSEMLLGEPRPFFGMYLGRDGPPGSDYYNIPELLPMGNLLKFGHLHDDDASDIKTVRSAIDRSRRSIDKEAIMDQGGRMFLEEWREVQRSTGNKSQTEGGSR